MKLPKKSKRTQLTLRLPASLHEALKVQAAVEGVPLNQYCLYILSRAIGADVGPLKHISKVNKSIKK